VKRKEQENIISSSSQLETHSLSSSSSLSLPLSLSSSSSPPVSPRAPSSPSTSWADEAEREEKGFEREGRFFIDLPIAEWMEGTAEGKRKGEGEGRPLTANDILTLELKGNKSSVALVCGMKVSTPQKEKEKEKEGDGNSVSPEELEIGDGSPRSLSTTSNSPGSFCFPLPLPLPSPPQEKREAESVASGTTQASGYSDVAELGLLGKGKDLCATKKEVMNKAKENNAKVRNYFHGSFVFILFGILFLTSIFIGLPFFVKLF
jgi:hypothetical protein